jgi:hypothetical protein
MSIGHVKSVTVLGGTDILPDSRAKETKARIFTQIGTWIPVFCANCGADGGSVPEENMNFVFYLCAKCAETYGQIAGHMMMPDEVFFERLKQEQLAAHGRYLTQLELAKVVEEDASPLAKLLKEGS